MSKNIKYIEDFEEIPDIFFSTKTKDIFQHCFVCSINLLEHNKAYSIQKVFNDEQTIAELVCCEDCNETLIKSYSKKSLNDIWDYILDRVNLEHRRKSLLKNHGTNIEKWLEYCLLCNKHKNQIDNYVIIAGFDRRWILYDMYPGMVCESCSLGMCDIMSQQSRDAWDKWSNDNIKILPQSSKDKKAPKVLFI